jgi:hypothetical protein
MINKLSSIRLILLFIDGLALVGVVAFSVLATLHPHARGYVAGQVVCALLILASVILLRRSVNRAA